MAPPANDKVVYLDAAATSWPKPPEVLAALTRHLADSGGNPGRAGHRLSLAAGRNLCAVREGLAALFGLKDPSRIAFSSGATESLNLALRGLLRRGDVVVADPLIHNASARVISALAHEGVHVVHAPPDASGAFDLDAFVAALRTAAEQCRGRVLGLLTLASNVSGTIAPLGAAAEAAREADAMLVVDAAQAVGHLPIDLAEAPNALLAFAGHKGLLGLQGSGGLALGAEIDPALLIPLRRGGTGSRSESEEQPDFLPDRFEAGTPNPPGIVALGAGVALLRAASLDAEEERGAEKSRLLIEGLCRIGGLRILGPGPEARRIGLVSFTVEGADPAAVALALDDEFGVLCRVGLHCAPRAHRALGSYPDGAIRFAPGRDVDEDALHYALDSLAQVLKRERSR